MIVKFAIRKSTQDKEIEILELSNRSYGRLKGYTIETVGDIINKWNEIPKLRGMGATSVKEIASKVLDLAISEMDEQQMSDFIIEMIKNNSVNDIKPIMDKILN